GGHPVDEVDVKGLVDRLVVLLSDDDVQDRALALERGAAILGVEVQDQDVAPLGWPLQRRDGDGEWMLEERRDLALRRVVALARIDAQRPLEWVALVLGRQLR